MKLLSVNLACPRQIVIGKETVDTGIFKEPTTAPVAIGELGLANDYIADLVHHGGKDQAVYLYSREEYAWWEAELGRPLPDGQFGENFTISSYGAPEPRIGDRYQINDLVLEAAFVRIPCSKFGAKMGDMGFPKRFSVALKPGVYCRVITPGTVQAGDAITFTPAPEGAPTASEIFGVYLGIDRSREMVERCLASPMADDMRVRYALWMEA